MNNTVHQLKSLLNYWLDNVDEHSLHSPFFFSFYTNTLRPAVHSAGIQRYEAFRQKLLADDRSIVVDDLGAGSKFFKPDSERKVCDIARTSLSPQKFSNLYSCIILKNNYKSIIELGTSLGLNTMYLASSPDTRVTTFEGADAVAVIAEELFNSAGADNIKLVRGNIDDTLADELALINAVDFALMDANHRYEPTMKYFDLVASKTTPKSMIVLDDIHSSIDMEKAWTTIQHDSRVWATADLFRCGVVFFDPSLNKQHVVLRF